MENGLDKEEIDSKHDSKEIWTAEGDSGSKYVPRTRGSFRVTGYRIWTFAILIGLGGLKLFQGAKTGAFMGSWIEAGGCAVLAAL
jgi:hypothetical protein